MCQDNTDIYEIESTALLKSSILESLVAPSFLGTCCCCPFGDATLLGSAPKAQCKASSFHHYPNQLRTQGYMYPQDCPFSWRESAARAESKVSSFHHHPNASTQGRLPWLLTKLLQLSSSGSVQAGEGVGAGTNKSALPPVSLYVPQPIKRNPSAKVLPSFSRTPKGLLFTSPHILLIKPERLSKRRSPTKWQQRRSHTTTIKWQQRRR
jgi:hypothetical protein